MRFLWMLIVPAVLPSNTSRAERIAIAWSGMRGGVSLAAALAITHEGFPDRDLVIFVAYAVIVLTLVAARADAGAAACGGSGWWRARSTGARRPRRGCGSRRPRSSASTSWPTRRPSTSSQRMRDRYGSRVERLEARMEGDHDEDGRTDVAQRRAGCWRR